MSGNYSNHESKINKYIPIIFIEIYLLGTLLYLYIPANNQLEAYSKTAITFYTFLLIWIIRFIKNWITLHV